MTLNAKKSFKKIFWRFRAARHFSRANCAKIKRNRHRQAAYEIFGIKRRFRWCKSRFFLGSRKPAHDGIKERHSRKCRYFTVVGLQFFVKTVADYHGHAAYDNKH